MKKLNLLIVVLLLFAVTAVRAQSGNDNFGKKLLFATTGAHELSKNRDFTKKGTRLFNPQLLNVSYQSMNINGYDSYPDSGEKLSQLGLAVSGGYAIADNLFILGQVAGQSLKLGSSDAAKLSFISIGAGVRYYTAQTMGDFFVGAGLLANNGKVSSGGYDSEYGDSDLSTTIVGYRAEAGYVILLLPSLALEPSISYGGKLAGGTIKSGGQEMGSKLKYSQFGINLGVSIFF